MRLHSISGREHLLAFRTFDYFEEKKKKKHYQHQICNFSVDTRDPKAQKFASSQQKLKDNMAPNRLEAGAFPVS